MKINRLDLIKALQAVMPGLSQKEIIEQSTAFVFTKTGYVVTYNDEIAVSHPVEVDFVGAVPAKEFFALVNKVKTEEIELEIKDNELLLKGSRAKAGLRIDKKIILPILTLAQPEEEDWKKVPANFCEAISFCLFSVSREVSKPIINCIHVHKGKVESTDNNRVTQYDMGAVKKAFEDHTLIPAHAVKAIVNNKPTHYAKTDGWLHFTNKDDVTFSCRIFEDDFPDASAFFAQKGGSIEFPKTLNDVLDKAVIFSNGERVTILLSGNRMTVSSEGVSGWFKEDVRAEYKGEDVSFDIYPEFMKSIMKITNKAEICAKVLKFIGDNFIHVVALVKSKKKE